MHDLACGSSRAVRTARADTKRTGCVSSGSPVPGGTAAPGHCPTYDERQDPAGRHAGALPRRRLRPLYADRRKGGTVR
jgi:hypothetical protein